MLLTDPLRDDGGEEMNSRQGEGVRRGDRGNMGGEGESKLGVQKQETAVARAGQGLAFLDKDRKRYSPNPELRKRPLRIGYQDVNRGSINSQVVLDICNENEIVFIGEPFIWEGGTTQHPNFVCGNHVAPRTRVVSYVNKKPNRW